MLKIIDIVPDPIGDNNASAANPFVVPEDNMTLEFHYEGMATSTDNDFVGGEGKLDLGLFLVNPPIVPEDLVFFFRDDIHIFGTAGIGPTGMRFSGAGRYTFATAGTYWTYVFFSLQDGLNVTYLNGTVTIRDKRGLITD